MSNHYIASEAAYTAPPVCPASFGLLFVEMLSAAIAFLLATHLNRVYQIDEQGVSWVETTIGGFFIISLLIFLMHESCGWPLVVRIWQRTARRPRICCLNLRGLVLWYAILDFVTLGILLYQTGGPEKSIYTPFLFAIVPVAVAIKTDPPFRVWCYLALTIGVFALCLRLQADVACKNADLRKIMLCFVTGLCSMLPPFVYHMEKKYGTKTDTAKLAAMEEISAGR